MINNKEYIWLPLF